MRVLLQIQNVLGLNERGLQYVNEDKYSPIQSNLFQEDNFPIEGSAVNALFSFPAGVHRL